MIHSGKKTVVLGLGQSGEAAAALLLENGAEVTICESSQSPSLQDKAAALRAQGIRVLLGAAAEEDLSIYDLAVLSPGIDPMVSLVQNVLRKNIPLIGELELAFQECTCPVVAITGTNGKPRPPSSPKKSFQLATFAQFPAEILGSPLQRPFNRASS